jgi:hypothetical protein
MTGSFAAATEYGGEHTVRAAYRGKLRDRADGRYLLPAGTQCVGFGLILARFGYEEPVLGIQVREQGGTDILRLERGFDDPHRRKRMLPLARKPSDGVGDSGGAFGAVSFASYDVAVHVVISRAYGLDMAPDAATTGEPLYIAEYQHRRPDICSTTGQLGEKLYDPLSCY